MTRRNMRPKANRVSAKGRWIRLAAALAASWLLAACEGTPPPTVGAGHLGPRTRRLVRLPDGRQLAFRCSGRGAPTILLEGGYGATSLGWTVVQAKLERRTHVCAYDRAGLGDSDPGPSPRDGDAIAEDLAQGLRAAHERGPFIVVGHSTGALYARIFAARERGRVVGLVLLDPSVEDQPERFARAFGVGAGSTTPLRDRAQACITRAAEAGVGARPACVEGGSVKTWRTEVAELESLWTRTSDQARKTTTALRNMPVLIVTASRTQSDPRAQAFWLSLHHALGAAWSQPRFATIDSGHLVMSDAPASVASLVQQMAALHARGPGSGVPHAPAAGF